MDSKWNIYKEFSRLGKLLFQQGMVSLTAGNISVRKGDDIYITASGSMLGDLRLEDIVVMPIKDHGFVPSGNLKKPSIESVVHKSIYEKTQHKAIVHVHAPTAIAVSFNKNSITLADSEGKFYIPEVPVVAVNGGIASLDVAREIPPLLEKYPAVIIKGHGLFTAADDLAGACSLASTVEFSAGILLNKEKYDRNNG
ncbi:MAG: class II aldolase/adducin family protein [Elusimicrobiota bacterium]